MTYSSHRRHFLKCVCAALLGSSVMFSGGVQASSARDKDTLIFVNYRDLRDLNPHLYAGEMYAQEMLFEGLVTLGNDGKYHGAVAQSWEISADGRVYTFKSAPDSSLRTVRSLMPTLSRRISMRSSTTKHVIHGLR